ncbi:MAG: oxygen-independent coproporphyrinogen III oxidase [Hyphomonadaceae bacterium]
MDPHLRPYAERQAPRYTSYPSAPHFDAGVDGAVYANWLRALDENATLSLYLHVPYCRQLCWYCGCNTFLTRGGDIADFVTSMMMEIDLVSAELKPRKVSELHWGGGTPNILSATEFLRLKHHIDFWFDSAADTAHAIELDPRYVTRELADAYVEAGVNRASLGVQDFNPHVQAAIGRVQPFELVRHAVHTLRQAGLGNLSFDLMYGLAGQSHADLANSIKLAAELAPDRIALFGYAHVPWFKRRQRLINADLLPDANERYEQSELARRMLGDLGYESIGLDHFARPGDALAAAAQSHSLHRNFQGYVAQTSDALIGFGPSAISQLPSGYAQNIPTVGAWRRAIEFGHLPIVRGHVQSEDDVRRAAIIQAIMCDLEVDLSPWGGADAFPEAIEALTPLASEGIVDLSGDKLSVPPAMRQFCRLAAMAFDAYAGQSPISHSRAI